MRRCKSRKQHETARMSSLHHFREKTNLRKNKKKWQTSGCANVIAGAIKTKCGAS